MPPINPSQAKAQAELMITRVQMGEPSSSGRLRQLELHRVLSTAMHCEGIAYRTLCFTLYGRVSSQHCALLFGHISTLRSHLSCVYYCADIQASSDGQGNCSFLSVLPQRTRADEQPAGGASAPGLTFVMTPLGVFVCTLWTWALDMGQ